MTLGTLIWIGIIGGVFYMMMKNGGGCCGGHDHGGHGGHGGDGGSKDGPDKSHAHHQLEKHPSTAGTEKDPVCGMDVEKKSLASTYNGKNYYFCSDSCKVTFETNPNNFV